MSTEGPAPTIVEQAPAMATPAAVYAQTVAEPSPSSDFHSCAQIFTPAQRAVDGTTGFHPKGVEALDVRYLWPNGAVLNVQIIG